MSKEVSGIITRRYCNACGYLSRQREVPPLDLNIRCPKCGKEQFEYKGLLSTEFQSGIPGTNSCECPHCRKKVSYDFKGGDEMSTCPECGGKIVVSTLGATWFHEAVLETPMYAEPWFMPVHPHITFERMVSWDRVLGYRVRPNDVIHQLENENTRPGPYSWDLACKLARLGQMIENLINDSPNCKTEVERWFQDRFGCLIQNDKLQGVKPPEPPRPKGFWESLFG